MSVTVMTSVLFTDLVDSTALGSRLGPEGAEELRQAHFAILRAVVAATGGTEVKNLGDGLMVAFTSPSRALGCATGMQQSIHRYNFRAAQPLSIRIGLSVGEAVEDNGDYFGDPVIEAARLCGLAGGGRILTTTLVQALAGRHGAYEFAPAGSLTLKGIPEPVDACEVHWEPLDNAGDVALPTPLVAKARDATYGFFGRTEELALIDEVAKRCFAEPQLNTVLIGGEAGIGKTSVAAFVATRLHHEGSIVLLGRSDEALTVPYQPWIQALTHLVSSLGPECLENLSPMHRAALGRLIPELHDEKTPRGDGGDSERLVLIHAIELLLKQVATATPVLIVLDDLHWADAASLHVLRHLVSLAEAIPLLVLCTYRHTDLAQEDSLTTLLADLHRAPNVARLRLGGFGDSEVVELVTAVAGHELDANGVVLAHSLRRETDGNPFFTSELIRHLGESGMLHQGAQGKWVVEGDLAQLALPASVRDVVAQRVARLGPEAARILTLASVVGQEFSLELVALLSERSEDEVLDVFEAATVAGVVRELDFAPGSYHFGHALIQRTLYEDLSASRRGRAHQRVGEYLEMTYGGDRSHAAELARHWVAAIRPREHDKALLYVIEAADQALASLAPDDAIRWYDQALELAARAGAAEALRCRLLVGRGTAERQIGAPQSRTTLLEAITIARSIDDTELLVAAVLAADRGIAGTSASDQEWVRATEVALERIGSADSIGRARLLGVLSQMIDAQEWERRRDLSDEAVAVARRVGDAATLLALLPVAYQHLGPEALAQRDHDTSEALALAESTGDPLAGCNALFHRIDFCMQAARIDEFHHRIDELDVLAHAAGLPLHLWQLHMARSFEALVAGESSRAEVEANTALEVGLSGGHSEAMLAYGAQLLDIRRQQGRLEEMIEMLEQIAGENMSAIGFRQLLGSMYGDVGKFEKARAMLAPDLEVGFATVPRDEAWLMLMLCCASTAASINDARASQLLYDQLLPYRRRIVAVYATTSGAIDRHLGCLARIIGDEQSAEDHFNDAIDMHEIIQAPYWMAATQLDLADFLITRDAPNDRERAAQFIIAARAISESHNFPGHLSRIAALEA